MSKPSVNLQYHENSFKELLRCSETTTFVSRQWNIDLIYSKHPRCCTKRAKALRLRQNLFFRYHFQLNVLQFKFKFHRNLFLRIQLTLTHCGLVTPYGTSDLVQHWFRLWLVAWRHQAITWTNVDFLSLRSRLRYHNHQSLKLAWKLFF